MKISVIIPALNEADGIARTLEGLQAWRARGHEVILCDGGSQDGTQAAAEGLVDTITACPRGRALQMNAGAGLAKGRVLLFLHADTALPASGDASLRQALEESGRDWGRFDIRLSGSGVLYRLIEGLMNLRSRLTHICTGDQAIFITRSTFLQIGGFSNIPLMEDIEISKRLKAVGPPVCLKERALTSSRRWEDHGPLRTILTMWALRLAYFLGCRPDRLERIYSRPVRQ